MSSDADKTSVGHTFSVRWANLWKTLMALHEDGYRIVLFDGSDLDDKGAFFARAVRDLPMGDATLATEVAWGVPRTWDAFTDFLVDGLSELGAKRIVVVWCNSDALLIRCEAVFIEAVEAFEWVAHVLGERLPQQGEQSVKMRLLTVNG